MLKIRNDRMVKKEFAVGFAGDVPARLEEMFSERGRV